MQYRYAKFIATRYLQSAGERYVCHKIEYESLQTLDLISAIADIMTIFGVGGFFTWSFVKQSLKGNDIPSIGISIFSYSIKVFLCFMAVLILLIPAKFLHFFFVIAFSGSYIPSLGDGLWNEEKSYAYMAAYCFTSLLFIPIAVLTASSIITWSVKPFALFIGSFKNKSTG